MIQEERQLNIVLSKSLSYISTLWVPNIIANTISSTEIND